MNMLLALLAAIWTGSLVAFPATNPMIIGLLVAANTFLGLGTFLYMTKLSQQQSTNLTWMGGLDSFSYVIIAYSVAFGYITLCLAPTQDAYIARMGIIIVGCVVGYVMLSRTKLDNLELKDMVFVVEGGLLPLLAIVIGENVASGKVNPETTATIFVVTMLVSLAWSKRRYCLSRDETMITGAVLMLTITAVIILAALAATATTWVLFLGVILASLVRGMMLSRQIAVVTIHA